MSRPLETESVVNLDKFDEWPEAALDIKITSDSFRNSELSVADVAHVSVLVPPSGLSPFISSCIVVNYISAGYVLLPWGECACIFDSPSLDSILLTHTVI